MSKQKDVKYGFALSGGGARGFAHLGAIQALKEKDISPSVLAGTSAGAIAAAFIADGYDPEEALQIFIDQKLYSVIGLSLPKRGLGSIQGMEKVLKKHIRTKKIEDFDIPVSFTATDLQHGKAVHFTEGEVIPRVMASASIPIIFQPVRIGEIDYVDGGVMDNLPVDAVKEKCDKIIAIDTNPGIEKAEFTNLISIAERVFYLSFSKQSPEKIGAVDLFIEPDVYKFSWFDLGKSAQIYKAGYQAALKALKDKV